jgi:signal transduction histidine kinase
MSRVTTMGELAASIAHEVNQPLAAVVTNGNACMRWLGAAEPNLDEARAAITRIIKEGRRAADVIGRIRTLMKKSEPQMDALDVNEVIKEVLTLTGHEISRRGVTLRTGLAAGLPPIAGDPVQLQQVLVNLIMNAIEATAARGEGPRELLVTSEELVISEEDGSDRIVVGVRDSGVGIDSENMDRLFEPFFTTKATGMGMGLSISRSVIERHGGRLWAAPNEGAGATFRFSLPVLKAA